VEGLLTTARILQFAAVISLTGVFAFECLVLGPASRQAGVAAQKTLGLRRRLGVAGVGEPSGGGWSQAPPGSPPWRPI
jgi:hypothetical protein